MKFCICSCHLPKDENNVSNDFSCDCETIKCISCYELLDRVCILESKFGNLNLNNIEQNKIVQEQLPLIYQKIQHLENRIGNISALSKKHEEYLCKIDKIAFHDPVKTLENMKILSNEINEHDEKIHDLENIEAEKRLIALESKKSTPPKKPHKCPVCDGIGKGNKYCSEESKKVIFFVCSVCDGKGVVWG